MASKLPLSKSGRCGAVVAAIAFAALATVSRASSESVTSGSDESSNLSVRQSAPVIAPSDTGPGSTPLHGAQFWVSSTSAANVYGAKATPAVGSSFSLTDLSGYGQVASADVIGTGPSEMKMYADKASDYTPASSTGYSTSELNNNGANPGTFTFSSLGKSFATPAATAAPASTPLNFNLNIAATPEPGAAGLIVFLAGIGGLSLRFRKPLKSRA